MKFCTSCGTQLSDEAQFCSACGKKTEQPPAQADDAGGNGQPPAQAVGAEESKQSPPAPNARTAKKGPGGVVFLLLGFAAAAAVMAVLFVTGILKLDLGGPEPRLEGEGYDSPEEAVTAYAEYLKEGNLEGMLSTFAVESYVENFDMAMYIEMNGIILSPRAMAVTGTYPWNNDPGAALNLELRRQQVCDIIYAQYISQLLAGTEYESILDGMPKPLDAPSDEAEQFIRILRRPPGFSNMKIGKALFGEDMLSESVLEQHSEILTRPNAAKADKLQDVCLELTIDGADYFLFFQTGRYHGKWYNMDSNSTLALLLGESSARFCGGLYPVG